MTNTTTTAIDTMTKTEVIEALIAGGESRSARSLRDVRVADLRAMLALQQRSTKPVTITVEDATTLSDGTVIDHAATYTVAEVAEMVGLTKFAVRRWVRVGHLSNQTPEERDSAIDGAELAEFLSARETKAAAKAADAE